MAYSRPDPGLSAMKEAFQELRKLVGLLEETHGQTHATTIRVNTTMLWGAAFYNLQEARTDLAALQKQATKYLSSGHSQLDRIQDMTDNFDARIAATNDSNLSIREGAAPSRTARLGSDVSTSRDSVGHLPVVASSSCNPGPASTTARHQSTEQGASIPPLPGRQSGHGSHGRGGDARRPGPQGSTGSSSGRRR